MARGLEKVFELWKSDGTEAGTVLVKVLNFQPYSGAFRGTLPELTIVTDILFFSVIDETDGQVVFNVFL